MEDSLFMNESTSVWNHTSTVGPDGANYPTVWGYIAILITVTLFGSNFVPVKKFETGDGVFFQFIACCTIWIGGCVMNFVMGFPKFYPLAMLGGFLWCTGNMLCVPIIQMIGLGQGICIWSALNLLSGWASARFGFFNTGAERPSRPSMNYTGVSFNVLSTVAYMFLRTTVKKVHQTDINPTGGGAWPQPVSAEHNNGSAQQPNHDVTDDVPLLINQAATNETKSESVIPLLDQLSPRAKGILGRILAVIAGTLFGFNFTPVIYIQHNYPGESQKHELEFVFSHFCGILASSFFYLVAYCILTRNRPKVYPRAILPAVISGGMWAVADIGWFVANDALRPAISFPIITSFPAIIGTLWGVFFGEIRGRRNFIVLGLAITLAGTGSILNGLSK